MCTCVAYTLRLCMNMENEEPQGTIPMTMMEKLPWQHVDDKGKEQVEGDDNCDHGCGDDEEEAG